MSRFLRRVRFALDHRWAPDRMSDYLDGELVPGGRSRMERHLGECDECRRVLTGLRRMLDVLRLLPAPGDVDAARIAAAVRLRLAGQPRSD